ncbi:MAG: helix-turn-helix transcriptional regulator [Verrucomicrobia bacterium]|nr:helix-turn-helix transcriptional regulator [Cytophagales bacterium]
MSIPKKILARQYQITSDYLNALDKHLLDIVEGRATEMFEIKDIAAVLHIHPTHLSNTIKLTTGNSACSFFEEKILNIAKAMLEKNENSISFVATLLTYDPSNFTKFFKHFTNTTPKQYREDFLKSQRNSNTITVTKKTVAITIN